MKIVTIIAGYENEDVLPFTAKAPLEFSEKVVFVDGVRPIIKRSDPIITWDKYKKVPYSEDRTEEICDKLGVLYLRIKKPLYNGEKINLAKYYLDSINVEYDKILYLESDEAIEPEDIDLFIHNIDSNVSFVSFDLIQLWKEFTGFRISPSCSKLINDIHYVFSNEDEGHNARNIINISFNNIIEGVRMYHLHFFRKKALQRVYNGIWYGGGDKGGIDIDKSKFDLERTDFLSDIYKHLPIQEKNVHIKDERNTYIGVIGDDIN